MSEYLFYWKNKTVARNSGGWLMHAAGEQLGKVRRDDVLWVVTFEHGTLYLAGRLEIDRRVKQDEAEQILNDTNLWKATHHVIAKRGTEEYLAAIDLTDVALALRFESDIDRLPRNYTAMSLRRMRKLTPSSAMLLKQLWSATVLQPEAENHREQVTEPLKTLRGRRKTQGFASSTEVRRAIETYAMQRAADYFASDGYEVYDESVGNPYDLYCERDGVELFVEVKGTQTTGDAVILTKNEVGFARQNKKQMALFIIHSVNAPSGSGVVSGGEYRVVNPWDIDQGTLIATQYLYTPDE
jgi:hypothetical protein